jgi:hypothetical protein
MSTLELKELSHPSGEVIKIAAGKTLDLKSQGIVTMPTGSTLQVVQSSSTFARTTISSTGSWTDTNCSISITPTSSTSKVLITVCQPTRVGGSTPIRGAIRLLRDSTAVWNAGSFQEHIHVRNAADEHDTILYAVQLDSPATTSAITYKLQAILTTGTVMMMFEANYGARIIATEIQG